MEQTKKILARYKINKPVMIAVVVIILVWTTLLYIRSNTVKDPKVLQAERRSAMLELVNSVGAKPLSEQQKEEILNTFGGSNTAQYNFTPAEREQILRALNGR